MESADINGIGVTMKGFIPRRSMAFRRFSIPFRMVFCNATMPFAVAAPTFSKMRLRSL